uniref:Uncharacterized protein n=1 Tax=Oryzias melastigma TaxID=30732 RepID=A0A3B3DZL7_ORYME
MRLDLCVFLIRLSRLHIDFPPSLSIPSYFFAWSPVHLDSKNRSE